MRRQFPHIEKEGYALDCLINGQFTEARSYLVQLYIAWGANPPVWRKYADALQAELRLINDAGMLDRIVSDTIYWEAILDKNLDQW